MGCKRRKKLDGGCGLPPSFVSLSKREERESFNEENKTQRYDDDEERMDLMVDLSKKLMKDGWISCGEKKDERERRERERERDMVE